MDMVLTYWHWFIGALLLSLAFGVSWLALSGHPHRPQLAGRRLAVVRKQGGRRS